MSTPKERLELELKNLQAENKRGLLIGGGLLSIILLYLFWTSAQINVILDPEGMAEAATGLAIENIPQISENLSTTIKDAAPRVAQQTSSEILELVPMYRANLEREIMPIIDEVSAILADVSVQSALQSIDKTQSLSSMKQEAADAAATAVMVQLDAVLLEALEQKGEDGVTPQDSINKSLSELKRLDLELRNLQKGKGDPQERELLITWINILSQE